MTKHIFVTGGVVSSLGKGLTAASIGMLLERRGLKINLQKFDPYLNVDPGTMNPYQHGEVYVTDDGAETDLDIGHYERFTNAKITKDCNYTTGRIYHSVIQKERAGTYLGATVQVIPHVTDEIKRAIQRLRGDDVDVLITEIGGTVGDIESLPFLEAIRQFGQDVGRENCCFVHMTLVPYLRAAGEIKTKPTQHSVGTLREIGIQPDMLICRTEVPLAEEIRKKIALFCSVPADCVIAEEDVKFSVYEVPEVLASQGVDRRILERLGLSGGELRMDDWKEILARVRSPRGEVEVAVVGKYIQHQDAYKSIYESLAHGGIAHGYKVRIRRVEADTVDPDTAPELLRGAAGIVVPGGFGFRGIPGKLAAIRHARERQIPYLGLCLGMQCASIEFARNVVGIPDANSMEFGPTENPVITLMEEQIGVKQVGGTMRLGAYPCCLGEGTMGEAVYEASRISERHRHRYEFNNRYREPFERHGWRFSGLSPDGTLVELIEYRDHPWFLACQYHPEFRSKPTRAHPLFRGFIGAAIKLSGGRAEETRREGAVSGAAGPGAGGESRPGREAERASVERPAVPREEGQTAEPAARIPVSAPSGASG